MSDDAAGRPDRETGRELVSGRTSTPVGWVLLTGERWIVACALLTAFAVALAGLFWVDLIAVTNPDTITRSLGALVGGNLTLVTIVISINQVILSQEFTSPADLEDRVREMVAYRQEAAELVESRVTPATPGDFLDFLVTVLREEAIPLRDEIDRLPPGDAQDDLTRLTDSLLGQTETISDALEGSASGPFDTLVVVLDARIAKDLYQTRRIQTIHGEALSEEASEHLADVVTVLEHIGVARQYLKSLYFRRALADLSRTILSTGVLALGLLVVVTWIYGGAGAPTVGGPALTVLVGGTGVVAFTPLAVFFAYVLRIATLTRRTVSLVPFTIRDESTV